MRPTTSRLARCCANPVSGYAEIWPGPLRCAVGPVIAPFSETSARFRRFVVQRSIRYEFFRHREIFRSDVRPWNRELPAGRSLVHRLDEFPAGYSLAGCSPALPASASPAANHSAAKRTRRSMAFHRTATTPLTSCLTPGVHFRPRVRHGGWSCLLTVHPPMPLQPDEVAIKNRAKAKG